MCPIQLAHGNIWRSPKCWEVTSQLVNELVTDKPYLQMTQDFRYPQERGNSNSWEEFKRRRVMEFYNSSINEAQGGRRGWSQSHNKEAGRAGSCTHAYTHARTHVPSHPTPRCKLSEKSPLKWILTRKEAIGKRACSEPVEVTTTVTNHECCPLAV